MNALIIEDEELTAERLSRLVQTHTKVDVITCLYSVKSAIKWLNSHPIPELIFLDIQLGDGSGFDILDQLSAFPYIIFTTAFDQYAIDAFKYNSIDYLLKPIKPQDLIDAVKKFELRSNPSNFQLPGLIQELKSQISKKFKHKFLIKVGTKYHSLTTNDIAYFYSEEGETYTRTTENQNYIVDHTLDALEAMLDPTDFFRINRHLIVKSNQIASIDAYFNNRLILELLPAFHETIIVSRERVKSFKEWMDS